MVRVLLGVTGSVAATLTTKLVNALIKEGHEVGVVITEKARTFLGDQLGGLGVPIYSDAHEWAWQDEITGDFAVRNIYLKGDPVLHVDLAHYYDVLLIAPATANTISKVANCIADNLLTCVALAWRQYKPFIIAPAMNTFMWRNLCRAMEDRIGFLRRYTTVPTREKKLACGTTGAGAMAGISDIIKKIPKTMTDNWDRPTEFLMNIPVYPHPGAFGYPRKGSKHTGVDLYCKAGDNVYAVEDGTVVCVEHFTGEWDGSPWWNNTDCILVEGSSGVICYGEINTDLKVGDKVNRGDIIANVVRVIKKGREHPEIPGWKPSMLHLEMYPKGTTKPSEGFTDQLIDPTPHLLRHYPKHLTYDDYKP